MRLAILLLLGATAAWPQASLLIDDFTTGNYFVALRIGSETDVQRGSRIIGGYRKTGFLISGNPYTQSGSLDIRRAPLVVSTGAGVGHRMELFYGVDRLGQVVPMNLDLTGYDRLRFNFDFTDAYLNFNVYLFTGVNYSVCALNMAPLTYAFVQDFPFSCFVPPPDGPGADFSRIDNIWAIFQTATPIGGNDYVITSISARSGP